jgi:hypothetical protein
MLASHSSGLQKPYKRHLCKQKQQSKNNGIFPQWRAFIKFCNRSGKFLVIPGIKYGYIIFTSKKLPDSCLL